MTYNDKYYQRFFYLPYDEVARLNKFRKQTKEIARALKTLSEYFVLEQHHFDSYICNLKRSYEAQSNENEL